MRTPKAMILAVVGTLALLGATVPQLVASAATERSTYLVRLAEPPLAAYRGGVAGIPATSPAARKATRLDVDSAASRAYLRHLGNRQDAVLATVSSALGRGVKPTFRYRYAYHGMALVLTAGEAGRVARTTGVASVRRAYTRKVQTDAGPTWIGAPEIWSGAATGGQPGTRGEGVVIGVVDTGVNHDHPSFADVGGDGYDHANPRGQFYGLCGPTGAPFCNDKLIGVHDFTGTGPQDDNGHGSHTASTSGGNVLKATVHAPTTEITRDLSGVAPHANLITYKGCLPTGNCLAPALVAAIDQAVADQVDVINYSIGGGPNDPWNDDDSLAFLAAREAGVFVATSAGNSGPNPETVGSPANSPWLLSVGASTHDRTFLNQLVDLSGGTTPPGDLTGKSFTSGYGPAPIVYAGDHGDALCGTPFAPGTFDGQIVVCDRGVNPRLEKGRNVKLGGAGGMVLVNTEAEGESTVADPHELPAVNLGFTDGAALKAWLADGGTGHTGSISGTQISQADTNGDVTAGFSSRGPNSPVPGVIKPDVTAPGVDILAAVHTTDPTAPAEYGLLSGTSMSSPHAAGAAALVRAVRRDWTPAQVQSALTSTGTTDVRKDDGATAADPFDMGGGRIDLTRAARAGLVMDVPAGDYLAADPAEGGDPTRLNLASLGQQDCRGTCTWTRTVQNTTGGTATWTVATQGPDGLALSVKPRRLKLSAGASATVTITADVSGATGTDWLFGGVSFTARGLPAQRLPVAVLPGGSAQDVEIEAGGTTGTHTVPVTTPVAIRDFTATVYGLQQGRVDTLSIEQDPTPLDPYDGLGGTRHVLVDVPAGARLVASEITDTTASDLDLFVGRDADGDGAPDAGEELCRSASEVALEACTLPTPEAGSYWVMVQNWLTGQAVDQVRLATTVIPGTDNGNLTVTGPTGKVAAGSTIDVQLAWSEPALAPGTTWLAMVRLGSDPEHPANVGTLLVRITRP
ncbi:MAG: S8 family serine peptidase [Micromonosporaceae bacterium]